MRQIISIAALAIIIVCLIWTSQLTGQDTRESLLISIILAIAASLISAHYSTLGLATENTKLIDKIGAQSSEKILNESKQPYSIEQYLDEKKNQLTENETNSEAIIYLESTRNIKHKAMLSLIYARGWRRSEPLNLKPTDIISNRGLLLIKQAKRKKDRIASVSGKLLTYYDSILRHIDRNCGCFKDRKFV